MSYVDFLLKNKNIAHVILNRPEKSNALNTAFIQELTTLLEKINRNKEIRVVILKSTGKNFCAGADIHSKHPLKNPSKEKITHHIKNLAHMFKVIYQLKKPTIALIQGASFGGSNGIVSCCDVAIASEDARFCFPEVKLGIIPASISPYVINAIGERSARYYFLTAKLFNAQEALRIGLIHQITTKDQLEHLGQETAQQLIGNGPNAIKTTKDLLRCYRPIDPKFINRALKIYTNIRTSPEAQERIQAFLEKRKIK